MDLNPGTVNKVNRQITVSQINSERLHAVPQLTFVKVGTIKTVLLTGLCIEKTRASVSPKLFFPYTGILYQVDTSVIALSPNSGQRKQKDQNNQYLKKKGPAR